MSAGRFGGQIDMSAYAKLGEVRTYYEEDGAGEPLVVLHPGGADSRVFESNLARLSSDFHVYRPDRRGHGRTPDVPGPITYELMAKDTIAFLEQVVGGPAHVVGHSDGAVVALVTALLRPDLVRRLVFASAVFHHDAWAPGAIDLDDETLAFFVEYHGEVSPDGPEAFHGPLREAAPHAVRGAGADRRRPRRLPGPALVMVGDDEDEISIEHALALRDGLPQDSSRSCPARGTACSTTGPSSAISW